MIIVICAVIRLWTHKNNLFTCKKQCASLSIKQKSSSEGWMNLCINVPKPQASIYAYCDDHFEGYSNQINCKLDTCRVCCVTADQVFKTKNDMKRLESCFQKCGKTFIENPNRESK